MGELNMPWDFVTERIPSEVTSDSAMNHVNVQCTMYSLEFKYFINPTRILNDHLNLKDSSLPVSHYVIICS